MSFIAGYLMGVEEGGSPTPTLTERIKSLLSAASFTVQSPGSSDIWRFDVCNIAKDIPEFYVYQATFDSDNEYEYKSSEYFMSNLPMRVWKNSELAFAIAYGVHPTLRYNGYSFDTSQNEPYLSKCLVTESVVLMVNFEDGYAADANTIILGTSEITISGTETSHDGTVKEYASATGKAQFGIARNNVNTSQHRIFTDKPFEEFAADYESFFNACAYHYSNKS